MTSTIDRTSQPEEDRVLYDSVTDEPRDDRSYDTEGPGAGTAGGAVGGAAAGAIAGTLIGGPVGTAIGAAVGAVGGAIAGRAMEAVGEDDTGDIDPGAGGLAGPDGLGLGANITPFVAGTAVGVGGLGIPVSPEEGDERYMEAGPVHPDKVKGPFDNAASYDESAAKVGRDRPILVGDDPGVEAVEDNPGSFD